jgi:serine phosphatase RsbU (regulator of sigma subunit)
VTGIDISIPAILSLLLVAAIVYAVYRYMVEQGQRQTALQQEYRNARAVQQVLIPDEIPSIPGFSMQSVYKPFGDSLVRKTSDSEARGQTVAKQRTVG